MNSLDLPASGSRLLDGPAGAMEVVFDLPQTVSQGIAIVTHPQPLLGGHAMHKVPQLLARALCDAGWLVARPNFRGVGRTAGSHDGGMGETDDVLTLVDLLRDRWPGLRLSLIGFSFGAFVQARAARALCDRGAPAWRICLAGLPFGDVEGGRRYDTPDVAPDTLVIHGEHDERVPLRAVLDWARPQAQPIVVVSGADHFFTGRLHLLRSLVVTHLRD